MSVRRNLLSVIPSHKIARREKSAFPVVPRELNALGRSVFHWLWMVLRQDRFVRLARIALTIVMRIPFAGLPGAMESAYRFVEGRGKCRLVPMPARPATSG